MKAPLDLVPCVPYHARLQRSSCEGRHEKANHAAANPAKAGQRQVSRAVLLNTLALCVGCDVGAQRRRDTLGAK